MDNYPLHLLATFSHFYPTHTPQHIVKSPDHDIWVAAAQAGAENFNLASAEEQARTTFTWQTAKAKQTLFKRPMPHWARYPAGVIYVLCAEGMDLPGVYAAWISTEAPGPRAEYGVAMSIAALWYTLFERPYTAASLREVLEKVRREYLKP